MPNTQYLLDTIENLRATMDDISCGISKLSTNERLPDDIRQDLFYTSARIDAALLITVTLKETI